MRLLARLSWVEAKLFLREPLALIFTFAFPFFMLIVLAGVFGNDIDPTDAENLRVWRGVGPTKRSPRSCSSLPALSKLTSSTSWPSSAPPPAT